MSFSNRIRLGCDYFLNREVTKSYPIMISVEPTSRCNVRCIMCPTSGIGSHDNRQRGDMTLNTFKRILSQVDGKVDTLGFIGAGDPLLCKGLSEMIMLARKTSIKTSLFTNALALTEEMSEELLDHGLDYIHFSVDGATKETYEAIRVGSDFDKVVSNILKFCEIKLKKQAKNTTYIQLIVSDRTRGEVKQYYDFWKKVKGMDYIRLKPLLDHLFTGNKEDVPGQRERPCFAS